MTNDSHDFVIKLALILLLSILPSVIYLLIFRRVKQRWQSRLRRARNMTAHRYRERLPNFYSDRSRASSRYYIGDISCRNNAHSPYIRCAINPSGPCETCSHYEEKNNTRSL